MGKRYVRYCEVEMKLPMNMNIKIYSDGKLIYKIEIRKIRAKAAVIFERVLSFVFF